MKEEQAVSQASTGESKSDEWSDFEKSLEVLLRNRRKGDSASESSTSSHPPLGSPAIPATMAPTSSTAASVTEMISPPPPPTTRDQVTSVPVQPNLAFPFSMHTSTQRTRPAVVADSLMNVPRRPASVDLRAPLTTGRLGTPFTNLVQQGPRFRAPLSLNFQPRPPTNSPASFLPIPVRVGIPPPSSFVPIQVGIPPPSHPQSYLPLSIRPEQMIYPSYPSTATQVSHSSIAENSYLNYASEGIQQQQQQQQCGLVAPGRSFLDNSISELPLCELCPSPSPFNKSEESSHLASHDASMFQCAGCGHRLASYSHMETHVQEEHVGNDPELTKLSIIIPGHTDLLKVFQCGIKTCSRRFVALTEEDLKKHIGKAHGEFYIHMGQGRNILRLCRLCSEDRKFQSNEDLTAHILMEHPPSFYANGESLSILPGSQQIKVLLNRYPQPLSKPFSPQRSSNSSIGLMTGVADSNDCSDLTPVEKVALVDEKRKITILRKTPEKDPDGSVITDRKRKRKRISSQCHNLKDESTAEDNGEGYDSSSKRSRKSKTKEMLEYKQTKKRNEMSSSLSVSPNKSIKRNTKDKLKKNFHGTKKKYETNGEFSKSSSKSKNSFKPVAPPASSFPAKIQVYCEACNHETSDWSVHVHSHNHTKNNQKSRCYFCPSRVWFPQLKNHISTHHKKKSFVCNAVDICGVQLMSLSKMVDHINAGHRRDLEPLFARTGTNYATPGLLAKHGIMSLPEDLRKLTCKICDYQFLAQNREVIVDHLTLAHQLSDKHEIETNILYECRACEALLFGSEKHLLRHIQTHHQNSRLNVDWKTKREQSHEPHRKSLSDSYWPHEEKKEPHRSPHSDYFLESQEFRYKRMYRSTSYHEDRDYGDSQSFSAPNVVQRFKNNFHYSPKHRKSSSSSWYPESTSSWYNESNSSWYPEASPDIVEACPFCDKRLLSSRQTQHQQTHHSEFLFSCDNFCTLKFKSAWKSEVLSHLKADHHKMKSDEMLLRHYIRLPSNLKMICCKIPSCDAAMYLGRSPNEMEDRLKKHVNRHHLGKTLSDCFTLACRSCGFVAPFDQEELWLEHFTMDHRKKEFSTNQSAPMIASLSIGKDKELDETKIKEETPDCVEKDEKIYDGNEEDTNTVRDKPTASQCKFCTKPVLKTEEQDHALENHMNQLFHCNACEDIGDVWVSFSVEDLAAHLSKSHVDQECKVSAPPDGEVMMSVCTVCEAQFYTKDPAVLATHLLDHDMDLNLDMYRTFCRLCGEQTESDHFRTAHQEEYKCCVEKNKLKSSMEQSEINHFGIKTGECNLENSTLSGEQVNKNDQVKTRRSLSNSIRNGKVVKVQHNPKEKYKIVDLKDKNATPVRRRKSKEYSFQSKDILNQDTMPAIEVIPNQELIEERCLYCPEDMKLESLPFHVLTQHKKLTFRCTMCTDSKIKKLGNKVCFDTLDEASQHMNQVHNIDLTIMRFEASVRGRQGGSGKSCTVQPLVKVYCPGLSVPADLKQWKCNNCTTKLFYKSSGESHEQICAKRNVRNTSTREDVAEKDENFNLSCRLCEANFTSEEQFLLHLK